MPGRFSPIEDRLKVYELLQQSVKAGSYRGPTKFLREMEVYGYELPRRETVRRWATGENSPLSGKRLFDYKASPELSFFLGAWIGDGWADDSDGGKRLLLKVRSYDFAKEFADCAAKVLHKTDTYWVRRVHDKRGRWFLVKVTSFQLYEFVNRSLSDLLSFIEAFPGISFVEYSQPKETQW